MTTEQEQSATDAVAALASLDADGIADQVAAWMESAYSLKASRLPLGAPVPSADGKASLALRLLERGEGRTLLVVLPPDAVMTWQDVLASADASWGVRADSTLVASLQPVSRELAAAIDIDKDGLEANVRLYGRAQLEEIYKAFQPAVASPNL